MLCSSLTRRQSNRLYLDVMREENNSELLRRLCREDLFYILSVAMGRKDVDRDWLYERCREVELNPNGHLDLWAREHYKSTIITFGHSIKDILNDPEVTISIFSHTRPIAKGFLVQIKRELEDNTFLKDLFPDVLYKDPRKESPKWGLDDGIIVRRKGNPKESTVEAWGLVDGQPTSKHFRIRVYDDTVTRESVTTPDQIAKTTEAWELSDNLGTEGGVERYIGTRYHYFDTYRTMMDRGVVTPRIYPATDDGTMEGKPVLLAKNSLEAKRKKQGSYVFGCQMLQNPKEDSVMGFTQSDLMFYDQLKNHQGWNFYILIDPASEKKTTSDYTVIEVWGLAPDQNVYLVDAVRDRMKLTERTRKLFEFHRMYRPIGVGYEKYGMQTDIEHIEYEMEIQNYRFTITPVGGSMAKNDRIRRLVPWFEQNRIWLPHQLIFVNYEKKAVDFVRDFLQDEYLAFPVCVHDDMLDCASRLCDMDLKFPEEQKYIFSATNDTEPDMVKTEYDVLAS